jgi:hypothetical protein
MCIGTPSYALSGCSARSRQLGIGVLADPLREKPEPSRLRALP